MKNSLEKILGFAKKSLAAAGLLASLASYSPKANGDVIFSMESGNTRDILRVWDTNSNILKLFVNADNTEENKPTSEVQWKVEYPSDFTLFSIKQPSPYIENCINGDGCEEDKDFFYPYPMPSMNNPSNSVSLEKSTRATKTVTDFNGNTYRFGPEKKQGRVAIFYFQIPQGINLDTSIGTNGLKVAYRKFKITNTKSYATDGTEQPSQGSEMTVMFVPSYNLLNTNAFILQDKNFGIPNIHVTPFSKQLCLEVSRDSQNKNWTPIFTNSFYSTEYNLWMSFDFMDKNATNHQKNIYRARSLD